MPNANPVFKIVKEKKASVFGYQEKLTDFLKIYCQLP